MMSDNTVSPGSRCLFCARSTLRRRGGSSSRRQLQSYVLSEEYLDNHPHVRAYAQNELGTQEITSGRICHPCIQCASRYFAKKQKRLAIIADATKREFETSSEGSSEAPFNDVLPLDDSQDIPIEPNDEVAMSAPDEDDENDLKDEPEEGAANGQTLPIPGFSRVSRTMSCVVTGCGVRSGLCRINIVIRTAILRQCSIYIPPAVRVCNEHLNSNVIWRDFPEYTRTRHETFDSVQIADMLRLLQRPVD